MISGSSLMLSIFLYRYISDSIDFCDPFVLIISLAFLCLDIKNEVTIPRLFFLACQVSIDKNTKVSSLILLISRGTLFVKLLLLTSGYGITSAFISFNL